MPVQCKCIINPIKGVQKNLLEKEFIKDAYLGVIFVSNLCRLLHAFLKT